MTKNVMFLLPPIPEYPSVWPAFSQKGKRVPYRGLTLVVENAGDITYPSSFPLT